MRKGRLLAVALTVAACLVACGDDDPVGPEFGDLAFSPAGTTDIGLDREAAARLTNVSGTTVGPIVIGPSPAIGLPPIDVGEQCPVQTVVVPGNVASLAGGAGVDLDISIDDTDPAVVGCPAGQYQIEFVASAGGMSLATMALVISVNE